MKTLAEEIKEDIAHEDKAIEFAAESVRYYTERLETWQAELAEAERRKAALQRHLEREVATLRKTQPVGVKLGAFDV